MCFYDDEIIMIILLCLFNKLPRHYCTSNYELEM